MVKLLKVARPQFLIVGLALFVLGALVAVVLGAPFSLNRLLVGYLVILPAQLSVHFSNDYFDVASDRPGGPTLISGGGGVLLEHPELREPVKWIAIGLILFSFAMGIYFVRTYAYPFWIMGFIALGNLAGWFYSAPPLRLSYRGLGELCYTFAAGLLIPAMGYLTMRGALDTGGIFFLAPLILYGLVSILSVEIPDMEDDRLSNKRTWVADRGRRFGFMVIGWLLLIVTGYFFLFPQFNPRQLPLDFRIVGYLSLLPLVPGLLGLIKKPAEKQPAAKIATWIVIMLALFSILVDGYLLYLTSRLLN
jgi:1,4-dihydroxy-2-naphthoate octaprenyltransferase